MSIRYTVLSRREDATTFHRFCARLLREYAPLAGLEPNFVIYDTGDSLRVLRRALAEAGVTEDAVQFVDKPDRAMVDAMLKKNDYIDLFPHSGDEFLRDV